MDHLAPQPTEHSSDTNDLARFLSAVGVQSGYIASFVLSTLQAVGAIVMLKAVHSGRYVFATEGAAQLFGRRAEQLIGASDSELMSVDEASSMRKAEQAVQAQRAQVLSEHRLERNGHRREFSVSRGLIDEAYLCSVWVERTHERYQEAQLGRALEQLGQQQSANEQMRREMQQGSGRDHRTIFSSSI